MAERPRTAEHQRLADSMARKADWKNWGPYVADRAWGTVREDYSAGGTAWEYFPHDHARSRAYRWNEDGLAGFCNRFQNICLAVALWNEQDPILKERFFGLTNSQGNHGEDVKEYYFHLDAAPTHSYMKMLYKYPQVAYPYDSLVEENNRRSPADPEFELIHALQQAFAEQRYFDVFIEYAKAGEEDILCRISAVNRGPDAAPLHILPHIWARNTWSWRHNPERAEFVATQSAAVRIDHRHLGQRWWHVKSQRGDCQLLFTENDTNSERLFGVRNDAAYVKDAFHEAVVNGQKDRTNPDGKGSKVAGHCHAVIESGESFTVQVRFTNQENTKPFADFDRVFERRIREADQFYAAVQREDLTDDERLVQRQALAGLLWSKQFYHYSVELWLEGDPAQPEPPPERRHRRNEDWTHLYNLDVVSMPDKWEYPWYAAWDLAFHCLPLAMVDPEWAKRQIVLLLREWYTHPNGQMPAYEWNLGDVNPPVHAWAAWRVYKISRNVTGETDTGFLEQVFHKLLLNFTWWVNRKDSRGKNVFQGGFLGLDNIGVFDRNLPLDGGESLEQADGTGWMGMYCLNMLAIALELARTRPAYEPIATKFFEHFIYISQAINCHCAGTGLWDEKDGFYYDALQAADGSTRRLAIRSFVGLIPLFAVETLDPALLEKLPSFRRRMEWFLRYRPDWVANIASITEPGEGGLRLLAIPDRNKLERVLARVCDPAQFLSDFGIRSLSREHAEHPFTLDRNGGTLSVGYEPAESTTNLFGGNSNWRGPIWFPLNYLLIETLQKYHHYYGDSLTVKLPSGTGRPLNLDEVAAEFARRLIGIFTRNEEGQRAVFGGNKYFQGDEHWRDHLLFHEYFHGDNGAGLGASHQTGWTALVAKLIQRCGGSVKQ